MSGISCRCVRSLTSCISERMSLLSDISYDRICSSPSLSPDGISSSAISCGGIRSLASRSSNKMQSSSDNICGGIRSTPARSLASRWSRNGLLVIFDVSNQLGRGLSSREPALTSLCLSDLHTPVQALSVHLCFSFALMTDSKNPYSCSGGDPCILRTF